MTFSYLSVCSGIEAASLAFATLGATPVGFAEIEKFPSAIIAARHGSNMPGEALSHNAPPNFGDFTKIPLDALPRVDVLIGGTPCQAFSVAGRRLSLADARGNLTLAFAVLAHELARSHGLRNVVWENVPGALNTTDNAFGCFLGAIVGADDALHTPDGGSWPDAGMVAGPRARAAWRVLDAQYFGLAQRRRRVFLVADFGNGADPAAVLFEPAGMRRNPPARGKEGEGVAAAIGGGPDGGRLSGNVTAKWSRGTGGPAGDEAYNLVAHALRADGFDAGEDGTGRGTPIVPVQAFYSTESRCDNIPPLNVAPPLKIGSNGGGQAPAVAFDLRGREGGAQFEGPHDTANIRAASGGSSRSYVAQQWAVRRLTPRECERLQGVPDDYTAIAWRGKPANQCPDGPRYKALGNSWAVPVVRWIGARLAAELEARP